jgi:hypothetical protein
MLLPARHARDDTLEKRRLSTQGRTFVVVSFRLTNAPSTRHWLTVHCPGWNHRGSHLRHTHNHILLNLQIQSTLPRRKESTTILQRQTALVILVESLPQAPAPK